MFKKLAYRGLLARLVKTHGVDPAVAHLLARACYPAPQEEDLPVEPQLPPKEVAARVEAWENTKRPALEELVASIFGQEQMDDVAEFIKLSRGLRSMGM